MAANAADPLASPGQVPRQEEGTIVLRRLRSTHAEEGVAQRRSFRLSSVENGTLKEGIQTRDKNIPAADGKPAVTARRRSRAGNSDEGQA